MKKVLKISIFLMLVTIMLAALLSCGDDEAAEGESGIIIISEEDFLSVVKPKNEKSLKFSLSELKAYEVEYLVQGESYCALAYMPGKSFESADFYLGGSFAEEKDFYIGCSDGTKKLDWEYNSGIYSIKNNGKSKKVNLYTALTFTLSNSSFIQSSVGVYFKYKLPLSESSYINDGESLTYKKDIYFKKHVDTELTVNYLTDEAYKKGDIDNSFIDSSDMQIGGKYYAVIDCVLSNPNLIEELDRATLLIEVLEKNGAENYSELKLDVESFPTSDYGKTDKSITASFNIYGGNETKKIRFIAALIPESYGEATLSVSVSSPVITFAKNSRAESDIKALSYAAEGSGLDYLLSSDGSYYTVTGIGSEWGDTIKIPSSYNDLPVKEIADSAFAFNNHIRDIDVGVSVEKIGASAFKGCQGLLNVFIPKSVNEIGADAFSGCDKAYIFCISQTKPDAWNENWNPDALPVNWSSDGIVFTLSEDEKSYSFSMGYGIFSEVFIPNIYRGLPVTQIKERAFEGKGIYSVIIPESVKIIGENAFYNSTIQSITIGSGVEKICSGAFLKCNYLNKVIYNGNIEKWLSLTLAGASVLDGVSEFYINGELAEDIVIPDTAEKINSYAFYGYEGLKSVKTGDGVIDIGDSAFKNCYNLSKVTLGEKISTVGERAFENCSLIEEISFADALTQIGQFAFAYCEKLKSLTLGSKLSHIYESAFYECKALTDLYYSGDTQSWCNIQIDGYYATPMYYADNFYQDGELLTELVIPSSVYVLKENSFLGFSSLKSVSLHSEIIGIKDSAFAYCSSIEEIVIPEGVDSLGVGVFLGCSGLRKVEFSKCLQVSYSMFKDCISLCELSAPNGFGNIDVSAFENCKSLKELTLSDSVKTVGNSAFKDCTGLVRFDIGYGVRSIGSQAFSGCVSLVSFKTGSALEKIENGAFSGCNSLVEVIKRYDTLSKDGGLENGRLLIHSAESLIEDRDGFLFLTADGTNYLLKYSGESTEVILPESYNGENYTLHNYAFYGNKAITKVTLPDALRTVGNYAFKDCTSLSEIVFGNIETISEGAFSGCTALHSLTLPDSLKTVFKEAFSECRSLSEVKLGEGLTSIGESMFAKCTSLKTVEIGSLVNTIGTSAFYYCTSLETVTLPDNVRAVNQYAFRNCESLKSILGAGGLTYIGMGAFENCGSLSGIYIGSLVTNISITAFDYCKSLAEINVSEDNISYKSIDGVLYTKDGGTLILYPLAKACEFFEVPSGVFVIGESAFKRNFNLKLLSISDTVREIKSEAFYQCINLSALELGSALTTIRSDAFELCAKLSNVINKSSLNIELGTSGNGGIGYYRPSVSSSGSIEKIGDFIFAKIGQVNYLLGCEGSSSEVILPENYSGESYYLAKYSFTDNTEITSVRISDGVSGIYSGAFSGCTNLNSAIFDNCEGWYCRNENNYTDNEIQRSELEDSENAAALLKLEKRFYFKKS